MHGHSCISRALSSTCTLDFLELGHVALPSFARTSCCFAKTVRVRQLIGARTLAGISCSSGDSRRLALSLWLWRIWFESFMDGPRGVHLFKLSHPPLTATPDQCRLVLCRSKKFRYGDRWKIGSTKNASLITGHRSTLASEHDAQFLETAKAEARYPFHLRMSQAHVWELLEQLPDGDLALKSC